MTELTAAMAEETAEEDTTDELGAVGWTRVGEAEVGRTTIGGRLA